MNNPEQPLPPFISNKAPNYGVQGIFNAPVQFAPLPSVLPEKVWMVPYRRNAFFTGREMLLAALYERFATDRITVLTQGQAISGLGGIGKTEVVVEYAYHHQSDYRFVLWVNAATQDQLISAFVSIADRLQLPERVLQEQQKIVAAVLGWLSTHEGWLLIVDNADELELVRPWLPTGDAGHVLLTTRDQAVGDMESFLVEEMDRIEGMLLLLRRVRMLKLGMELEQIPPTVRQVAEQIATEMGGLPLALDQAGAYIEEAGCELEEYLQAYQQRRAIILADRRSLSRGYPEPVATTWSLSFKRVEEQNPAAADLLRFCVFLAPDAIPEDLITGGARYLGPRLQPMEADLSLLNDMIGVLRSYSLIRRDIEVKTLSIHRLVQAVLRDSMASEAEKEWKQRAVLAVSAVFPSIDFTQWSTCERLTPHALVCASWIEQERMALPEALGLLHQTGYYLGKRSRYTEAERLLKLSLLISEQDLSVGPEITTTSMNILAGTYESRGKYKEAEALYQRTLEICQQYLGLTHPNTIQNLNDLGYLYEMQERYEEAESLYQSSLALSFATNGFDLQILQRVAEILSQENRSLDKQIKSIKVNNLELRLNDSDLQTLNNLASLYLQQGRDKEAEPLCRLVLALREQLLGAEHPDTGASLDNLATWYCKQGRYEEAGSLYQRILSICEKQQSGSEHPDTVLAFHNIADFYVKQGRYEDAELLYQRAQTIQERRLGDNPLRMTMNLFALANLYEIQGRYAQAQSLYQRVLATREMHLGPMHSGTAKCLNSLGKLYGHQGQYEQAKILLKRALTIWGQQSRLAHSDTASGLVNLAAIYEAQCKYRQAESLLKRALAIWEQCSGVMHTATALNNLGELYREQGKYEQAEPLLKRALAIWEQCSDAKHHVAYTLNNLAELYKSQGKYEQVEPLLERALATWEQQLGAEHPHIAVILGNLANLYQRQEKYEQAESLLERSLTIQRKWHGDEHPNVAVSMNHLADLYESQAKYVEAEELYQRVLAICKEHFGTNHAKTATSLNNLGYLYAQQNRYAEAESLYQQALHVWEHVLSPDHPYIAASLNNLADLYVRQEMYTEAEPLFLRALQIRERQLGAEHPDTATSLNNLAGLYGGQGRYVDAEPLYQRAVQISLASLGMEHSQTQQIMRNYLTLLARIHTNGDVEALLQLLAQGKQDKNTDGETIHN